MAVARISLAILLLVDLTQRWSHLGAHYSDDGVLPRVVLLPTVWDPAWFSYATLSGHPMGLSLFFAAFFGAVWSMALGYRTTWSTFAVWLGLVSIQNRNPMILDNADAFLRLTLFWMLFLPLGAAWSLDAKAGIKPPSGVSSIAHLALVLQTCVLLGQAWQNGMGVSSFAGVAFFAVAACVATTLLPPWWWDVALGPLIRRWASPEQFVESASLTTGIRELRLQRVYKMVFGLFVVWVLAENLMVMTRPNTDSQPSIMFLRLDLPRPSVPGVAPLTSESGRFVMEGVLRDGTVLRRADAVESSFDLADRRWRNYLTALRASGSPALLDAYGEFLCRKRWSSPRSLHGLVEVKVSFLHPPSTARPSDSSEVREEVLLEYRMRGSRK